MKIRQLVWIETDPGCEYVAFGLNGTYEVGITIGWWGNWTYGAQGRPINRDANKSMDEVMAMCQADFEMHVKECLRKNVLDNLDLSHQRYEKLRKLNPRQFQELWSKNIETGIGFDDLVDALEA